MREEGERERERERERENVAALPHTLRLHNSYITIVCETAKWSDILFCYAQTDFSRFTKRTA